MFPFAPARPNASAPTRAAVLLHFSSPHHLAPRVLPVFAAAAMLSWCLARPPLKCVREGARLLKTQEPSDVTDREAAVVEVALSEVGSHFIEHLREAKILRSKPTCQGPRTNPQRLCDVADAGPCRAAEAAGSRSRRRL